MQRIVIVKGGVVNSIEVSGNVRLTVLTILHSQKPDKVIVQTDTTEQVYGPDGRLVETLLQGTLMDVPANGQPALL